jgi:sugar lactone lactonase YvrE
MVRFAVMVLISLALAGPLASTASAAQAGPSPRTLTSGPSTGDLLVTDLSGAHGLSDYSPITGLLTPISTGGLLTQPMDVALESDSTALVSVLGGKIVRVDLRSGAQQLVASGGLISANPDGLLMGANGLLYVADVLNHSIISVNPVNGAQALVTSGPQLDQHVFMIWQDSNNLLISSTGVSKILRVRISDGTQTVVASGGNIESPEGLAFDSAGRLLVADYHANVLMAIDLSSGTQTVIATGFNAPVALALDGLGYAYVGTYAQSTSGLTRVNLSTGARTAISTPSMYTFGVQLYSSSAPPPPPPPPPAAPAAFTASDDQPDGVHLAWSPVAAAAGYQLYRNSQLINTVLATDSTYLDVPAVGTYTYCIAAVNNGGSSSQVCDSGNRRAYRTAPDLRFVKDVPNDQGGKVQVAWLGSEFDTATQHTVTSYRLWRRLPSTDGLAAPAGATVRSVHTSIAAAAKGNVVNGDAVSYWELLVTVPAARLQGYGAIVATTQDSLPGSNPYTAFFVSALTADPNIFYDSDVDSGYSVDNIAPQPPSAVTARMIGGSAVDLSWQPNTESDLAGYRVYRGGTPQFVTSPVTLLAALTDTGYVDPASSAPYYKLTAVDKHGNESANILVTPGSTTGVVDGGPAQFALGGAVPNPTSGRDLTIAFSLAVAGPARVSLVDVSGRMLRNLALPAAQAGPQTVHLAGSRLRDGVYLVRLEQGSRTAVTKIVVHD